MTVSERVHLGEIVVILRPGAADSSRSPRLPCTGGTDLGGQLCLYDESGDAVQNNTYAGNGFYGNPTNGDIALTNLEPGPTDCFAGNHDSGGSLTTTPSGLESAYPDCTVVQIWGNGCNPPQ